MAVLITLKEITIFAGIALTGDIIKSDNGLTMM